MSAVARDVAPLAAVLLDLDGTLADTAADLAHALNHLRGGIVTNKLERFAAPLLRALDVWPDADCLITPDLLRLPKPDPEGVLLACARLGVTPAASVFVGDDPRDIAAGQAAGTRTVAAGYGYIAPGEDEAVWGADACIDSPAGLLALCQRWGA